MRKMIVVLAIALMPWEARGEDVKLTLSDQEMQQVFAALAAQPFKDVVVVINKIQTQYADQRRPVAAPGSSSKN